MPILPELSTQPMMHRKVYTYINKGKIKESCTKNLSGLRFQLSGEAETRLLWRFGSTTRNTLNAGRGRARGKGLSTENELHSREVRNSTKEPDNLKEKEKQKSISPKQLHPG